MSVVPLAAGGNAFYGMPIRRLDRAGFTARGGAEWDGGRRGPNFLTSPRLKLFSASPREPLYFRERDGPETSRIAGLRYFFLHVKAKEILYGLGLRPPLREYSFDIERFRLPKDGDVDFAVWRHPSVLGRRRRGGGFRLTQAAVDVLRNFLRPGDVAIDIGAHTGDSTLPMALAVGKTGTVLALEPNIHAFKVLLANAGLNRSKTNIVPLNIAATPDDRTYQFEYSDAGFCNGGLHVGVSAWRHAHFFKLDVVGRNLPALLASSFPEEAGRIRYIKIDTEGFDRTVAASLRNTLVEQRPFLKTEFYKHASEDDRRGYYRELRSLGYDLYRVESDDEDYRAHPLDERDVMNWSHFDVFAAPQR